MHLLLHPAYFPNIATFAAMVQNEVIWEVNDNYQKQTYRNRCHICTDIGRHSLTIPIQHVGGNQGRQKYKDVKLNNAYSWQRQHWRTLQTAYRTSPFFEFYEDDLAPLFEKHHGFLLDFNFKTIEILCEILQVAMPSEKTSFYREETHTGDADIKPGKRNIKPETLCDARFLVNAKKEIPLQQQYYIQLFGERHGFIKNTSVLDLLFNEGTNALTYLQNQNRSFLCA